MKFPYSLGGEDLLKNKYGFFLAEAVLCAALSSVMCLWGLSVLQLAVKKEEIMDHIEEEINQSWEEIFMSLKECSACLMIEEKQEE